MSTDAEQPMLGAVRAAVCPETTPPCGNLTTDLICHNGGICCWRNNEEQFCACPKGYDGDDCSIEHLFMIFDESRDRSMKVINVSSLISIFIGLIALVALGVIIFVIVRSSLKRRHCGSQQTDPEKDLDKTIVFVQEEISKLSTVQQLNKLHRLSKVFEKTVREAILSEPGHRVERSIGRSVAMSEKLNRCSSAPTYINRPLNDLDMPDGLSRLEDDVFQSPKPKIQQVFFIQQ